MKYFKINEDFSVERTADAMEGWRSKEDYPLKLSEVVNGHLVSTVFLVLDHSLYEYGGPKIFETMVFEGDSVGTEIFCARYSCYEHALEGHEVAKKWVLNGCGESDE